MYGFRCSNVLHGKFSRTNSVVFALILKWVNLNIVKLKNKKTICVFAIF